jgi:hypothetical protein
LQKKPAAKSSQKPAAKASTQRPLKPPPYSKSDDSSFYTSEDEDAPQPPKRKAVKRDRAFTNKGVIPLSTRKTVEKKKAHSPGIPHSSSRNEDEQPPPSKKTKASQSYWDSEWQQKPAGKSSQKPAAEASAQFHCCAHLTMNGHPNFMFRLKDAMAGAGAFERIWAMDHRRNGGGWCKKYPVKTNVIFFSN